MIDERCAVVMAMAATRVGMLEIELERLFRHRGLFFVQALTQRDKGQPEKKVQNFLRLSCCASIYANLEGSE